MSAAELDQALADLQKQADAIAAQKLSLDMARGKPSSEQTALSKPMLDLVNSSTPLVDGKGIVDVLRARFWEFPLTRSWFPAPPA